MYTHFTFYFVMLDGTLPLDFAGPLQVLLEARRQGVAFEIEYVSDKKTLTIDGGLSLTNLKALPSSLNEHDVIVLPGNHNTFDTLNSEQSKTVITWLREVVVQHQVLTICSGALLAVKAGLLDNKSYTTHHSLIPKMQNYYPQAKALDNRLFVDEDNVITSAGISSGIDMALYFVAKRFKEQISAQVAQEMLVYFRRSGQDPQLSTWLKYRNHMHKTIHKVQNLICEDVSKVYSLDELAQCVYLSVRQLSRIFQEQLNITVGDYIAQIKIAKAKQYLQYSDLSIEAIAELCGFSSSRHFRRVWLKFESCSPLSFRKDTKFY